MFSPLIVHQLRANRHTENQSQSIILLQIIYDDYEDVDDDDYYQCSDFRLLIFVL